MVVPAPDSGPRQLPPGTAASSAPSGSLPATENVEPKLTELMFRLRAIKNSPEIDRGALVQTVQSLAECTYRAERYSRALEHCRELWTLVSEKSERAATIPPELMMYADTLFHLGDYRKVVDLLLPRLAAYGKTKLKQEPKSFDEPFVAALILAARAQIEVHEFESARKCLTLASRSIPKSAETSPGVGPDPSASPGAASLARINDLLAGAFAQQAEEIAAEFPGIAKRLLRSASEKLRVAEGYLSPTSDAVLRATHCSLQGFVDAQTGNLKRANDAFWTALTTVDLSNPNSAEVLECYLRSVGTFASAGWTGDGAGDSKAKSLPLSFADATENFRTIAERYFPARLGLYEKAIKFRIRLMESENDSSAVEQLSRNLMTKFELLLNARAPRLAISLDAIIARAAAGRDSRKLALFHGARMWNVATRFGICSAETLARLGRVYSTILIQCNKSELILDLLRVLEKRAIDLSRNNPKQASTIYLAIAQVRLEVGAKGLAIKFADQATELAGGNKIETLRAQRFQAVVEGAVFRREAHDSEMPAADQGAIDRLNAKVKQICSAAGFVWNNNGRVKFYERAISEGLRHGGYHAATELCLQLLEGSQEAEESKNLEATFSAFSATIENMLSQRRYSLAQELAEALLKRFESSSEVEMKMACAQMTQYLAVICEGKGDFFQALEWRQKERELLQYLEAEKEELACVQASAQLLQNLYQTNEAIILLEQALGLAENGRDSDKRTQLEILSELIDESQEFEDQDRFESYLEKKKKLEVGITPTSRKVIEAESQAEISIDDRIKTIETQIRQVDESYGESSSWAFGFRTQCATECVNLIVETEDPELKDRLRDKAAELFEINSQIATERLGPKDRTRPFALIEHASFIFTSYPQIPERLARVEKLLRSALGHAERIWKTPNKILVACYTDLAQVLGAQGRYADALAFVRQADAMAMRLCATPINRQLYLVLSTAREIYRNQGNSAAEDRIERRREKIRKLLGIAEDDEQPGYSE